MKYTYKIERVKLLLFSKINAYLVRVNIKLPSLWLMFSIITKLYFLELKEIFHGKFISNAFNVLHLSIWDKRDKQFGNILFNPLRTADRLVKKYEVSIFKPIRDIVRMVVREDSWEERFSIFRKLIMIGYQNTMP